jgi:hypothetical protein
MVSYNAEFKDSDYVSDLSEKIRKEYPAVSIEGSMELAKKSLENLKSMGNGALYRGLLKVGLEDIVDSYFKDVDSSLTSGL